MFLSVLAGKALIKWISYSLFLFNEMTSFGSNSEQERCWNIENINGLSKYMLGTLLQKDECFIHLQFSSMWRQEWGAFVADTGVPVQPLLFIPGESKSLQIWLQQDSLSGQTGSLITQPFNILRQGKFSACLVLSKCTRHWGWYSWHLILPIYKLFIWSELISYAPSIVKEGQRSWPGTFVPHRRWLASTSQGSCFSPVTAGKAQTTATAMTY